MGVGDRLQGGDTVTRPPDHCPRCGGFWRECKNRNGDGINVLECRACGQTALAKQIKTEPLFEVTP